MAVFGSAWPQGRSWLLLALLAAWLGADVGRFAVVAAPSVSPAAVDGEASRRLLAAVATQEATRARLGVPDGARCADAGLLSYRRSDLQAGVADQWYVASQLLADAELLRAARAWSVPAAGWDEADARCHLDKGFAFLGRLWDVDSGGYYPRAGLSGIDIERAVWYADDNALAGLALLAAADLEADPRTRQRYLADAGASATYLISSGLWDQTFGGGFWWNTGLGDRYEGKPAQTNAAAALLFARLYVATGDAAYREWALRTLAWLDAVLYDPDRQLYRWSIRYEDPRQRIGAPMLSGRTFNYDQSIAIEAQLLAHRLDGDPSRLDRARDLGRALHAAFWNADRGGYNLEAGVERVYTSYAAWASLGHLALYDLDGDAHWLDAARANADALAATFAEPDGGHAYRHYRCLNLTRPGCENGSAWVVDRTRDTAAQAWMQHLEAALARRLTGRVVWLPFGAE